VLCLSIKQCSTGQAIYYYHHYYCEENETKNLDVQLVHKKVGNCARFIFMRVVTTHCYCHRKLHNSLLRSCIRMPQCTCSCWYDTHTVKTTRLKTYITFTFNIQGSVHRKHIPLDIFPTRCNITQFIYFWKTALHILGGISSHHQEHTQLYLQYLVLVNRYFYLPLLWESWSWSEFGVGIVLICDFVEQFSRNK